MINTKRTLRSLSVMAALVLSLVALGGQAAAQDFTPDASTLVGSWNADFEAMIAAQQVSEEERAMMAQMMAGASMVMTFAADGTASYSATMMGQTQTDSGTYTVTAAAGQTLTVAITESSGEVEEAVLTFTDANTMSITDEGETMVFHRQQ